ncbi:MAG: VCBS repeat-containing protein, partial [Acidobacteriota bacterium]
LGQNVDSERIAVVDLFGVGEHTVVASGSDINTGIRAFSPPWNSTGGTFTSVGAHSSNAIGIGDLDRDGDLDILSGGLGFGPEPGLRLFEQTSPGIFTFHDLSETSINDLALVDWDGDGDLDAVAVNENPGQILWFENTTARQGVGGWSFAERDISPVLFPDHPSTYDDITVGDFDLDGIPEIWAANTVGMEPDPDQPFLVRLEYEALSYQIVTVASDIGLKTFTHDIDQDGDLDLVAVEFEGDQVSFLDPAGRAFRANGGVTSGDPVLLPRLEERNFGFVRLSNQLPAGSGALELRTIQLRADAYGSSPDNPPQPLSPGQISEVLGSLRVFADDGDTVFDAALDTLLVSATDFTFSDDGHLVVELPEAGLSVEPSAPNRVHLLLTLKATAPQLDWISFSLVPDGTVE